MQHFRVNKKTHNSEKSWIVQTFSGTPSTSQTSCERSASSSPKGEWPDEQQMRERKYQTVDQFHRHHDEFGDPIDLDDLGLDDMSLSRIVIELSQTREHFKVWTPFNEDFRVAIKQVYPTTRPAVGSGRALLESRLLLVRQRPRASTRSLPRPRTLLHRARHPDVRAAVSRGRGGGGGGGGSQEGQAQSTAAQGNAGDRRRRAKLRVATRRARQRRKLHRRPRTTYEWDEPEPPQDDPYEILGVSRKAPDEVIKAAHKALARKYHTDATGKDSDKDMKKVNAAFERIKELRKWNTKQQSST